MHAVTTRAEALQADGRPFVLFALGGGLLSFMDAREHRDDGVLRQVRWSAELFGRTAAELGTPTGAPTLPPTESTAPTTEPTSTPTATPSDDAGGEYAPGAEEDLLKERLAALSKDGRNMTPDEVLAVVMDQWRSAHGAKFGITNAPTQSPTAAPTNASSAPTAAPTRVNPATAMVAWLELRRACVEVLETDRSETLSYTALRKLATLVELHDICGESALLGNSRPTFPHHAECASLALPRLAPGAAGSGQRFVLDGSVLLRADHLLASGSAYAGGAKCADPIRAAKAAGMELRHLPIVCSWQLAA